jgi:hypothetical protein
MPREKAREIWTIDCETDPFAKGRIPEPFIWGLYTGTDYYQFLETEKLVEFIYDKKVICYAHNGGKFDWHFLLGYIVAFEEMTIINGRIAKFSIGDCEFRDSYNLIPAPLSAYKKDDIDYSLMEKSERNKPENWQKICDYLKADCVYLHEMVSDFIASYGLSLTQASAAMKFWSKSSGIAKPKSSVGYYDDMAPYYYGGRVECFHLGEYHGPFTVADIKSAYPYAMTFNHPWGLSYIQRETMPEHLDDEQLARSFIRLKAKSTGAFPYRSKEGLTFPSDGIEREFYVTGWEYIAAKETNTLIDPEIISVRHYLDSINFQQYVDYFYQLKIEAEQKGDASKRLFAKIFLNSLYGKFASNPINYETFMTVPTDAVLEIQNEGWEFCRAISDDVSIVVKPLDEERHRYYDIAVSASITGFVRAYLWRAIKAASGVMYCDTDCLVARDCGKLDIGEKVGQWGIDAHCDYAAIAGKKLYAFRMSNNKGYKTASKGVRLTPDEIIQVARGEAVTYSPDVPTFSVKNPIRFQARKITKSEK